MDFSSINYFAVLVAAVASFLLGFVWYSLLFGKAWQAELGFSDEYIKEGNMGKIFGSSFVLMIIMALGMAMLVQGHGEAREIGWLQGLYHGLYVGLFFVGTSMGINMLYQRQSFKLWTIDAAYQIAFLAMMGAILGAWQ